MVYAMGNAHAVQPFPSALVRQEGPARQRPEPVHREFYSIPELAERWRCSRGTVYNRLRKAGVKVMDWADRGKKSKKAVRASDIYQIETQQMKRLA